MLAVRRTDVDELNLRAPVHMRTVGLLVGADALYREAGYVGLSRGRQRNDLHLVERTASDHPEQEACHAPRSTGDDVDAAFTAVRDALGRSRAQSLGHDLGR